MEVEKRGIKGGFLQLFDWNGKSRKKLFLSKSDIPESSNHGRDDYHSSVIARHHSVLEKGFPHSENDYPYPSLSSSNSEKETKAPGVVARLMGLDSLPTSNVNEPCFNPFADDSNHLMAAHSEHDIVIFESVRNKLDGLSRNPLDLRLQKVNSRPLERFQREVLSPKSAKPISVTHNRLLSPMKTPGFIPPKNAAYIIEAAAKIIEQSPRSATKGNYPSLGSPSIPFRVRNLKEKMESAQPSSRSAGTSQNGKEGNPRNIKKQHNARSKGRIEDGHLYNGSEESKRASSQRVKNKEKSVKSNIPKKDGSTSSSTRAFEKQKELNGYGTRDLPNMRKKVEKQSSSRRPSDALRLNNQKQNRALAKDDDLEPSCSQTKEGQVSTIFNRTVNKIVVTDVATRRKTNFVTADCGKEVSSMRSKTASKKRLPMNENIHSRGGLSRKDIVMKDEKPVKCSVGVAFEGDSNWDGMNKQSSSSDVVSFTFTSPIKKSVGSNSSGVVLEATTSSSDSRTSSGFNVIAGDALSVLLDQKIKELSSKVEFDNSVSDSLSSSDNKYGNMGPTLNMVHMDNGMYKTKPDCNSADKHWLQAEKAIKGVEYLGGAGDINNNRRYLHLQGSTSLLNQPSVSGASSDSFDVVRSSSNEGAMASLSSDGTNWRSTRKPYLNEGDPEISDTASSLSETVSSTDYTNWELKYIRDILSHAELLLEEFSTGQSHKIVAPDLFVQLENQKMEPFGNVVERKVFFDCVCECLESRFGGGCIFWGKHMAMLHRRRWLADDLYREISSSVNVDELMVDEVVDKDMSSKSGKWVDFETEAFEQGIDIGDTILSCLVDELIHDFLL